jgi:hypothetical protein
MTESWLALMSDEYDGINFFRNDEDEIEIVSFQFKESGDKIGGTSTGDLYDIIIFPEDPPKMPEKFQAILSSPIDYIYNMIDNGFLGVISKVTTSSEKVVEEVFGNLCETVSEYIDYYEEEMKNV